MVDLEKGVWNRVEELRNVLENSIEESFNETIFVGKGTKRLPNTSLIINAGWRGETQVMQLDWLDTRYLPDLLVPVELGSAVLQSMGYDDEQSKSALRVSLGVGTTIEDAKAL